MIWTYTWVNISISLILFLNIDRGYALESISISVLTSTYNLEVEQNKNNIYILNAKSSLYNFISNMWVVLFLDQQLYHHTDKKGSKAIARSQQIKQSVAPKKKEQTTQDTALGLT